MVGPVVHAVGVEWMYASMTRGGDDPAELRLYATTTHANGRTAIRVELDSAGPTEVRIIDRATGQTAQTLILQPGLWPGPTTADKFQLPGNRTIAETNLALTI